MARIIIGDDDSGIREGLQEAMEMFGHEVVGTFPSAQATLSWLSSQENPCDLAILDNSFPPGNGGQVAAHLREKFPGVKIISLSGENVSWGDVNLAKPSRIREIKETISRLIG